MRTENTQRALYVVETAIQAAMESLGIKASHAAGFSLGELSALASAGVFSYQEGFRLVSIRASLMQKETEKLRTGMVAVLKLDDETVEKREGSGRTFTETQRLRRIPLPFHG